MDGINIVKYNHYMITAFTIKEYFDKTKLCDKNRGIVCRDAVKFLVDNSSHKYNQFYKDGIINNEIIVGITQYYYDLIDKKATDYIDNNDNNDNN